MECTAIFLITCFMCRFIPPKRFHSASCMRSARKTYDPPLLTGPSTSKSWKPYILVLHLNSIFLLMCFVTVVACALCGCLWLRYLSCLHLISTLQPGAALGGFGGLLLFLRYIDERRAIPKGGALGIYFKQSFMCLSIQIRLNADYVPLNAAINTLDGNKKWRNKLWM